MKKVATIAPLLALLLMLSCSKDDGYDTYSYNDPTLYSSSGKVALSEIILFLKPYIVADNGEKKYLVADSLRNISVTINGKKQRPSASYALDTAHVSNKSDVGGYRVTTEPIAYPVQIKVMLHPEDLQTAGEYASLLNDYFVLTPGVYIFQIQSFDVSSAAGQQRTIHTPTLSFPLKVEENSSSANMGEIEVEVTSM
ncbi:MAG: hypothetical protein LBJ57_01065 [Prevotellaceae bacterium]|jgi:hypothetical protein|nr:hypothetical protein [Prevotellaceae bacterium]